MSYYSAYRSILGAYLGISHVQVPKTHVQTKAKCKTFVVKMSSICMGIKYHFEINGFTLSLALKQRLEATRKWRIIIRFWETAHLPLP